VRVLLNRLGGRVTTSPAALLGKRHGARLDSTGRDIAIKLSETACRVALGIAVNAVAARTLGINGFGTISLALAVQSLVMPIAGAGLEQVLLRRVGETPTAAEAVLNQVNKVRRSTLLIAVVVLIMTSMTVSQLRSPVLVALLCLGLSAVNSEAVLAVLQIERGSAPVARIRLRAFGISAVARLTVLLFQPSVVGIVAGITLEPVATYFLANRWRRTHGTNNDRSDFAGDTPTGLALLRESMPYLAGALAIMVYTRIDAVLLAWLSTPRETGRYAAAVKISELVTFLPVAIGAALAPRILQRHGQDRNHALLMIRQWIFRLVVLGGAITIGIWSLAPLLIRTLFGPDYSSSAIVLRIHVLALVTVFAGIVRDIWLLAERQFLILTACTVTGAIVNVLLNLLLIPSYGSVGAAIATAVSYHIAVFIAPLVWQPGRELFRLTSPAQLDSTQRRSLATINWSENGDNTGNFDTQQPVETAQDPAGVVTR
jgi:polysaccharide transporter, PST family